MDPISGLLALFSSLGSSLGLTSAGAGAAGATTALAPAAGTGLGLSSTAGGLTGLTQGAAGLGLTGAPAVAAAPTSLSGLLGSIGGTGQAALGAAGLGGGVKDMLNAEKFYTTIKDPNMSLRGKFDAIAPMVMQKAEESKAQFGQLQQGAQAPVQPMMQMPSYATPSMPYQGGGIEEILARQRGLLR